MSRSRSSLGWRSYAGAFVAAAASVATSQLGWSIDAKTPTLTAPPDGSVYVYTIESSDPHPTVSHATDVPEISAESAIEPIEQPGDTNTSRLRVRMLPGQRLETATVSGNCEDQGCCAGQCGAPADAFVRITEPTVQPLWTVADERVVDLPTDEPCELHFDSQIAQSPSSLALRFRFVPDDLADREHMHASAGNSSTKGSVTIASSKGHTLKWDCKKRRSTRVTVIVSAHGTCDAEPCAPPAGTTVKIADLTTWR